jgi:hypothetical protein
MFTTNNKDSMQSVINNMKMNTLNGGSATQNH